MTARTTAAPADVTPAVLTIEQAATYLGLSRRTLERLAAERGQGPDRLPVVQLTKGRRHFRRSDLDAYIARHTS